MSSHCTERPESWSWPIATPEGCGRRQDEGAVKGRSGEIVAPDLISLFKKLRWQPGRTECHPIISIRQQAWEGEGRRKGTQEKKNGFDIQAGGLREVTSSWPFQRTWPPAVWWIMEPQMGHQGWDQGWNAWEPSLPGGKELPWQLNKRTPGGFNVSSFNSFLHMEQQYCFKRTDNTSMHTRIDFMSSLRGSE